MCFYPVYFYQKFFKENIVYCFSILCIQKSFIKFVAPIKCCANKDYSLKRIDFSSFWTNLIGSVPQVPREQRAFNAVVVISFLILLISIPINLYLGMFPIVLAVTPVLLWLIVVYYMSRMRNRYKLSMVIYGFLSYTMVSIVFYFNSGVSGPALSFSLMAFLLVLTFSEKSKQLYWLLLQLVFVVLLLFIAYYHADQIPFLYRSRADQYFDLAASSVTMVLCVFFIITYLRSSYFNEKRIAEERAELIELQNQELLKLNAEKNKLFSILAHDLRSPLNSITSVLNLLTSYPVSEEQRTKLKQELLDTTRNTSEMLLNLLSWSTGQLKGIEPKAQLLVLKDVLQRVMQMQQLIAQSKDIQIEDTVAEDIQLYADPDMLELILRNLINNAIKFTEPGGRVLLRATSNELDCLICVEDTGIGMTQDQVEQLFSLDIHSTYGTANEKGIGIGLMLCKDFTQMLGGALWVQSQQNQGSIFYLQFPSKA